MFALFENPMKSINLILDKLICYLNRILLTIAGCLLLGVTILTCSNVFLRIFGKPIPGTFELMGYFSAVLTAFALGYTQLKRGHIAVDVLVLKFPAKVRNFLNTINYFICMNFFILSKFLYLPSATISFTNVASLVMSTLEINP